MGMKSIISSKTRRVEKMRKRKSKKAYREWKRLRGRNRYKRKDGSISNIPSRVVATHDKSWLLEESKDEEELEMIVEELQNQEEKLEEKIDN